MEELIMIIFQIIFLLGISALVALLGKKRKIGYGISFLCCLFLSPLIGLIITLCSKKKDTDFVDVIKDKE